MRKAIAESPTSIKLLLALIPILGTVLTEANVRSTKWENEAMRLFQEREKLIQEKFAVQLALNDYINKEHYPKTSGRKL